jgi:glycosyltransferase involved in cell wall biosynthesis
MLNNIITKDLNLYKEHKFTFISHKKKPVTTVNHPGLKKVSELLFITTYPPRECGIATYTQDLILAIQKGFGPTFNISICALANEKEQHQYSKQIKYQLNTDDIASYQQLACDINADINIKMVILQHEFGLFGHHSDSLISMLHNIKKPISIVFHTVLPEPNETLKEQVKALASKVHTVIVMTRSSSDILKKDYDIKSSKIVVIPHGTHLVKQGDKDILKAKYDLTGKKVLSTFGFLGSGKSIETTLDAMPAIIAHEPETMFLIIGKTHPTTIQREGESYREFLQTKVAKSGLAAHVRFVNAFLPLNELLEYLQLTDIYLFTSKDPNQAVSGTFAYAISCGCPIISTPIPHAKEVLKDDAGIIIDFNSPDQLSASVNVLLDDVQYRMELGMNGLHKMASTAWENSAIAHANIIKRTTGGDFELSFKLPEVNLSHVKKLTTEIGMIQFAKINIPDTSTGYTLDDNARAMVAVCQHFVITGDEEDIRLIRIYNDFIRRCLQPEGNFLNYMDIDLNFTTQNNETNLEDSNGRAIWALGYLLANRGYLPADIVCIADEVFEKAIQNAKNIYSTRAMAFIIKGLYFAGLKMHKEHHVALINILGQRLLKMYLHEAESSWQWYESYLTYGNSIIPEAMLYAFISTGNKDYKEVAKETFDFLLSRTFSGDRMEVISNQTWMHKGTDFKIKVSGGEQPIDVAYTIMALKSFSNVFDNYDYDYKMKKAFNWFLGDNHLQQIMYNPCTGGCYDGLEQYNVNLNQGAESTVSYLMARLTVEQI